MSEIIVRHATEADCLRVLELMKELADFEGYLDKFRVTTDSLKHQYICEKRFHILVAEHEKRVEGILVYYFLPFTYDLTPWLFIKELYVSGHCRGNGAGEQLFRHARLECLALGGTKMKWEVLADNKRAQSFYAKQGALTEQAWQTMSLPVKGHWKKLAQ